MKESTDRRDNDYKAEEGQSRQEQQQSDPQLTELRGLTDGDSDLEPTLVDGTKAPDKAEAENREQGG